MHNCICLFIIWIGVSLSSFISSSILPIQECIIDKKGTFKYIQIHLKSIKNPLDNTILIRGSSSHDNHAQIYYAFLNEIENIYSKSIYQKFSFRPIGGGYIKITSNTIHIYGSSGTYGRCNHVLTSQKIKTYFLNKHYIYDFTNLDNDYNNIYYEE